MKGTTTKNTSQEGGFLNFIRLLTAAGLSLMKSKLTLLAKSVFLPLGFNSRNGSNRCSHSKQNS